MAWSTPHIHFYDVLFPTGQFKKSDQMLPNPKRGQNLEDRAHEIEGVLDWMRSNEVVPDETTLPSFLTADQDGPVPRPVRSPKAGSLRNHGVAAQS